MISTPHEAPSFRHEAQTAPHGTICPCTNGLRFVTKRRPLLADDLHPARSAFVSSRREGHSSRDDICSPPTDVHLREDAFSSSQSDLGALESEVRAFETEIREPAGGSLA
jgi:hypothetical protein